MDCVNCFHDGVCDRCHHDNISFSNYINRPEKELTVREVMVYCEKQGSCKKCTSSTPYCILNIETWNIEGRLQELTSIIRGKK